MRDEDHLLASKVRNLNILPEIFLRFSYLDASPLKRLGLGLGLGISGALLV